MPCKNRECRSKRVSASKTFSEIFQFEPTYNHYWLRVFLSEDEQKPLPCLEGFVSFDALVELGRKQLRLAAAKHVDLKYKDASPKAKQEIIAWYICAVTIVFQPRNSKRSIHHFVDCFTEMCDYVLKDVEGNQLTALIGAVFKAGRKDTGEQRCYDVLEKHVFPCIEGKVSEGNSEKQQNYAKLIQLAIEAGRTNTSDSYVNIDCSLGKFSDKLALLGGIESFRLFVPTKTEDVKESLRIIAGCWLARRAISVGTPKVPNKSQTQEQVDNLLELLLHRSTLSVEVDREYTWFCSKTAGVLVQEVKEVIEREASKVGMQQTCVVVSGSQAMHTSVMGSDVDLVVSCDTTTKQSELAKKLKNISEFLVVYDNVKKGADIIAVKYKNHNFDISIAVQSGNEISASLTQAELKWWEDIRKTYPDIEKVVVLLKAWKYLYPNRNRGLSKSLKGAAITCLVVGCCKETCAVNKRVNVLTVLRKSLGKLVDMRDNKFPRQIEALYEPYDDLTKAISKEEWNAVGMAAKEQLDSWGM